MEQIPNSKKKKIVLFTRFFYPNNSGFSNAATALVESISKYLDYELIVITHAPYIDDGVLKIKNTKIISTWGDNSLLSKLFKNKSINTLIFKLKFGWLYYYLSELRQFYLAKPHLRDMNLSAVIFETNTYPFIGEKVVDLVPDKTVIRFHAAEDTEELAYGGIQNKFSFIKKLRFKYKKESILKFSKRCKYIISTNSYYNDFFKEVLMEGNVYNIWNKNYYSVIPNTLSSVNDQILSDKKIEIELPPKYCLTLGRLDEPGWLQKGFDDLFNALGSMKKYELLPKGFRLFMVGDGQYKVKINTFIQRIGLKETVTHIEKTTRTETEYLLEHAAYVILPSRFEGQSMFLTEALAAGVPIISTKNTGSSDMIIHGKNGYLVEKGNSESIKEAILYMESKSKNELEQMSQFSKNLYEEKFSQAAVAKNVKNLLEVLELHT